MKQNTTFLLLCFYFLCNNLFAQIPDWLAYRYIKVASTAREAKDFPKSKDFLEQALKTAIVKKDAYAMGTAHEYYGLLYLDKNNPEFNKETAKQHLQTAKQHFQAENAVYSVDFIDKILAQDYNQETVISASTEKIKEEVKEKIKEKLENKNNTQNSDLPLAIKNENDYFIGFDVGAKGIKYCLFNDKKKEQGDSIKNFSLANLCDKGIKKQGYETTMQESANYIADVIQKNNRIRKNIIIFGSSGLESALKKCNMETDFKETIKNIFSKRGIENVEFQYITPKQEAEYQHYSMGENVAKTSVSIDFGSGNIKGGWLDTKDAMSDGEENFVSFDMKTPENEQEKGQVLTQMKEPIERAKQKGSIFFSGGVGFVAIACINPKKYLDSKKSRTDGGRAISFTIAEIDAFQTKLKTKSIETILAEKLKNETDISETEKEELKNNVKKTKFHENMEKFNNSLGVMSAMVQGTKGDYFYYNFGELGWIKSYTYQKIVSK